ncbi:MAG: hypothetical protein J6U21_16400 [Bacteroidales bacterium]|nr:hypothetical protein [Bacteroidales bacterium]
MEKTFVEIFSNFGFPIALCIVFIMIGVLAGRKAWEFFKKQEDDHQKLLDRYVESLQKANAELIGVLKENAMAFNSFSVVLERIEKKIKAAEN